MTKKRSYKVLWNVFLFVICGGSLIYGFVQQQRMSGRRAEHLIYREKIDSLNSEIKRCQEESELARTRIEAALDQLRIEKVRTEEALRQAQKNQK